MASIVLKTLRMETIDNQAHLDRKFQPRSLNSYFRFEILLFRRAIDAPTLQKVPDQT